MSPISWDAHACLPLHPAADFAPLERYRAAGVGYVSVNVGMDLNPVPQILAVIAGFRARLAASPDRYLLARSVADVESAAASGRLAVGFDLEGALSAVVALEARIPADAMTASILGTERTGRSWLTASML